MATIQWYPGHMAKAKRQVQERLKQVDVIFEIVDARVPESSRNPVLGDLVQTKPTVMILNKADLADPKQTQAWIQYYQQQGNAALALDAQHHQRLPQIAKLAQEILADKIAKQKARGIRQPIVKAMCIGIPNVGKSTILNRLINKNVAVTGNKPGVTKNQQWLKTKNNLEILDTPGILWPKFDDQKIGLKLALTGAIADNIFHDDEVALFAMDFFQKFYPSQFMKRWQLTAADFEQGLPDLMLQLTAKVGFKTDFDRFSQKLIQDYRQGFYGKMTFDRCPEPTVDHE